MHPLFPMTRNSYDIEQYNIVLCQYSPFVWKHYSRGHFRYNDEILFWDEVLSLNHPFPLNTLKISLITSFKKAIVHHCFWKDNHVLHLFSKWDLEIYFQLQFPLQVWKTIINCYVQKNKKTNTQRSWGWEEMTKTACQCKPLGCKYIIYMQHLYVAFTWWWH